VRLVFCGTAEFAVPALQACAARHDVAAVVTRADRPGSRGRPAPRPVAEAARELGIEVFTPLKIRSPDAVAELLAVGPECLVVAAYGQILPASLIDAPPHGAVNVHGSLLPRWRGASPIAHAILAGDVETGVSIMRMDSGLDTGPVYTRVSTAIVPDATTPALTEVLARLGAAALIEVLDALDQGRIEARAQPEEGVTLAPRLRREDGVVDWAARSGVEVDRMVRALQPWPGVVAPLAGVDVQVRAGAPADNSDGATPGTMVRHEGESVVVAAREGAYRLDQITPIGRRPMTPAAFLRGRRPAAEATAS
jgi:methionyl-tRNA formyltransferase